MKYFISLFLLLICARTLAQQTNYVDFKTANIEVEINPKKEYISGKVVYSFDVIKPVDSVFIDSRNLSYKSLYLNNKELVYYTKGKKLWLINDFKPSKNNILSIEYEGSPKNALYFVGWNNDAPNQIWTQGQGKYTSNWLPSFDDVNEKLEFDVTISFNKEYSVIANGKLIEKNVGDTETIWKYDMKQPMSSYLLALAIGKYDKKVEYSESGIPLEMFYYREDSSKVEPTYRYTKQMFDFLEKEIGVPYPWQNYKQVPVHDFLYSGMENTSCTIFSDAFMIDDIGFVDKNYVNVNAHELAHQWFGDLVTAKKGEHHWLHEGFATYYALLAEKEIFGNDYYYNRLYQYAQELFEQDKAGKSTALLNPKSSSTTFYKKGAWTLHVLREKLGEKIFKKAVKRYLMNHQFKNVETKDFLGQMEDLSGQDLTIFAFDWLRNKSLNSEQVYGSLNKNEFASAMIQMKEIDESSDITKLLSKCDEVLHADSFYPLQQELFLRIKKVDSPEAIQLYQRALRSGDLKKRQAVAQTLKEIPLALKTDYESLLHDKSYATIEAALYNLWNNFPEDQEIYLEQTKNIIGFNDKNVRTLWLVLAILTDNDELGDSNDFFQELNSYTSPNYHFEVRQNAFNKLRWIRSCREECIENLKDASNHHNWRFKQYAKRLLESH